jgi:hypothetical protein
MVSITGTKYQLRLEYIFCDATPCSAIEFNFLAPCFLLVVFFAFSSTPNTGAVLFSETSVEFYRTVLRYIPEYNRGTCPKPTYFVKITYWLFLVAVICSMNMLQWPSTNGYSVRSIFWDCEGYKRMYVEKSEYTIFVFWDSILFYFFHNRLLDTVSRPF